MSAPSLRAEAEAFLYDYAACLDDERFGEWPGFFEERCTYEILSRENWDLNLPAPIMGCYSHGMVKDRVAMLVKGTLTYRHMYLLRQVTNVRARLQDDGTVITAAGLVVHQSSEEGVSSLYMVGRYDAALTRAAGTFKIRTMRVILDSFGIDTMLAVPL